MESDTEEDDMESGFEEMKSDEEEAEETQDPHSSKFRATGQLLLHYEEEPSFEGYLMFKGGKRQVSVQLRVYLHVPCNSLAELHHCLSTCIRAAD